MKISLIPEFKLIKNQYLNYEHHKILNPNLDMFYLNYIVDI